MAESLICNKKAFRETANECLLCEHYYDCVVKGLKVALAQMDFPPKNLSMNASKPITQDLAQPLLIPHDYREIKTGDGMTFSIDLEEVKRELKKSLYEKSGLMYGA